MSLKATNNVETNKYELEIEISAEDFDDGNYGRRIYKGDQ